MNSAGLLPVRVPSGEPETTQQLGRGAIVASSRYRRRALQRQGCPHAPPAPDLSTQVLPTVWSDVLDVAQAGEGGVPEAQQSGGSADPGALDRPRRALRVSSVPAPKPRTRDPASSAGEQLDLARLRAVPGGDALASHRSPPRARDPASGAGLRGDTVNAGA